MGEIKIFGVVANAIKSLSRKKLRTILTMCSISVGVMMVVIVTMISGAGSVAVSAELDNMGISGLSISTDSSKHPKGNSGISEKNLELIRTVNGVETAMPLVVNNGLYEMGDNSDKTIICGIDAGAKQAISLSVLHGRMISKGDVMSENQVCVVDEAIAIRAYGRSNVVGKTITVSAAKGSAKLKIIGVAKAGSSLIETVGEYIPDMVYLPYTVSQSITGDKVFHQVAIRVKEGVSVENTEDNILSLLDKEIGFSGYFKADNLSVQKERLGSLLDIVTIVLTTISGISLLVSGIGIMTIMLVSVNERMREIGIKKSIGATNGRIMREFLVEALIISFIGSIIGVVIGAVISLVGLSIFGFFISFNFIGYMGLIGFSVLLGLIFGVVPAIKAARLKPVDALRME